MEKVPDNLFYYNLENETQAKHFNFITYLHCYLLGAQVFVFLSIVKYKGFLWKKLSLYVSG